MMAKYGETKKKGGEDKSALLTRLVRDFESAEQATFESRKESERDRDYYDGYQWTDQERETLRKRKQPCITINRIKPKVDFLLGLERKQRNDPKAFPREPGDEDSANAATDGIRFVLDDNQFDSTRSDVFENTLIEGLGGVDISVVPVGNEYRITVKHLHWDRIFFDPHSRRRDFSDARYVGQVVWLDYDDALAKYPQGKDIFESTISHEASLANTYDDKPQIRWTDPERKRIRIVEEWYRQDGQWKQCIFTKAGILDEKDSPYTDEEGNSEHPLELTSAFVDRDGNRYGVVRSWIGIQDEINKRRSKALHLLSVRQVRAEKGAVDDIEKTRRELAKPDGLIETNPGMEFEVLQTGDMAQAQFNLLQEAKSEIDAVGVNAALSGTEGRVMSGRALIARQEGGMAELGPVFDSLRLWQLRVYRKVWNRIRQYWTAEKWVRVTDDEKNPRHVGLNQEVTRIQAEIERATEAAQQNPQAMQQLQQLQQLASLPQEQLAEIAPEMLQVVEVRNNVADLDVDIILSEVPDTVAIQAEQFELLAKLAQSGVPIPPDALVEASGLRNKEAILKKMESGGMNPQMAEQMKAQQQAMQKAGEELAKREEQIQQEQQQAQMLKAELERKAEQIRFQESELALKKRVAELEIQLAMQPKPMPQPVAVQ